MFKTYLFLCEDILYQLETKKVGTSLFCIAQDSRYYYWVGASEEINIFYDT